MSIEKDTSSDDAFFIAVLKLEIGGAIRQTRKVLISAYDLEEAGERAKTICNKITRNWPTGCIDPKDYPYHPVWTVFVVIDARVDCIDLTLEDDFDKLDSGWLEDKLSVREANQYWLEAQEDVA